MKAFTAAKPTACCGRKSRHCWRRNPETLIMKRRLALLSLALVTVGLSGCASTNLTRVKPWERATLADYTMRPDRDPLHTAMTEHVFFSLETAAGGRGV